ncbi:tripartite tricarboxylate transporter TctB family protein [Roseibium marinum]|uniref:Tripartite tricarboxylate transporter TctB family protein n=1 Tax=Roseibium marinum TaxID=281252 RepID=A0A2S3V4A7_9HYPH|nr:tripartite tricarboxylate transporter TctB family protein [Roseibium marinum]POF34499.1 tripartite tricarboxylate transporter TctB family protein [Roseibium marinum]
MSDIDLVPEKIRSLWPPVILMLLSAAFTAWAQRYGDTPRLMPTLAGVATTVLALLDLLSRFDNRLGAGLRLALGADFRNREMTHDPAVAREAGQIGWMVACVVAMLVIGILPAIPLFITLYMRFWGRQPWIPSLIAAFVVLGFVSVVFEVLLDYTLYRGVLFDPKGFHAW